MTKSSPTTGAARRKPPRRPGRATMRATHSHTGRLWSGIPIPGVTVSHSNESRVSPDSRGKGPLRASSSSTYQTTHGA